MDLRPQASLPWLAERSGGRRVTSAVATVTTCSPVPPMPGSVYNPHIPAPGREPILEDLVRDWKLNFSFGTLEKFSKYIFCLYYCEL